ncbi:MAG: recombinase family protein [Mycobacterium sp.]|nr:recombinase family protein [Mycobacterium sp.]
MLIGYARVSTAEQDPALQLDALESAGAQRIYTDHGVSGSVASRPELDRCLDALREGDTLVVWRLDRLARSLRNLLDLVETLSKRGVHLRSLTESIDTGSASGRMILSVFGALAEFERELIRERTAAGLEAAKARGAKLGRPALLTDAQLDQARTLVAAGHRTTEVARTLGVGRSTLYRALRTTTEAAA